MTDKPKTAPHPAAANDPAHAKKAKAAPKPAPRAPIPSVTFKPEAPAGAKAGFFAGVTAVALGIPTVLILGAKHLPKLLRRR